MLGTNDVAPVTHVELTDFAIAEWKAIYRQARMELSGKISGKAFQNHISVDAALRDLERLDSSTIDTPLGGHLWFIKSMVHGDIQLFYARFVQPMPLVLVLHLGEVSTDPDGTYRLFTELVISGKFNSTLGALGIRIPDEILKAPSTYRVQ